MNLELPQAGAINGAIMCGNAPEARLDALDDLWGRTGRPPAASGTGPLEHARWTCAVLWTLAVGHPRVFAARHVPGSSFEPGGNRPLSSL
ncbi:hypothetical protein QUC32_03370 [Novosphingobium resinovorum]|uniref:hypothetical protein n=1 Tax=Novosphingobium TaxID=165696 RepID=UPI001B3C6656|nr:MULTISPECIES: hypothetical protein [Novosphingobium]MBF7013862.1 hypothetical protein [Novosphingobium sp. HR1a]WJM26010.1 hypothetical protein QUC32_03370 [Novosphingobium resinovorum]